MPFAFCRIRVGRIDEIGDGAVKVKLTTVDFRVFQFAFFAVKFFTTHAF